VAPSILLSESPSVVAIPNVQLSDGLWAQLNKGNVVKYGAPGGITREHIREAVEYVFNQPVPEERKMVFRVSSPQAMREFDRALKKKANSQMY